MITSPEGDTLTTRVYTREPDNYGCGMAQLDPIYDAADRVAEAQTALDEVAALFALQTLVTCSLRTAMAGALATHTAAEIARAAGVSRQAISQRVRAANDRAARASAGQPVPQPRRKDL